jgi:amino acid adenylation domain-containing protein
MKNVEDVYPLSPMQQGMLFHTVLDPQAGDYLTQLTGAIDGRATLDAFRNAWHEVIRRHAVLRTGFVWETLDQPLQVVHREAEMPCEEHDWRGQSDIEGAFKNFLADDRAAGFDLSSPPLMRLTVFEVDEERYRFVWTHHHLLLDGWSLPLVMQELFAFAGAAGGGRTMRFPQPRPYRDYIGWLAKQDESATEEYWRKTLTGFRAPTPVGGSAARERSQGRAHGEARRVLSGEANAKLTAAARQRRLTLNTFVQGAWALLLSRYSAENDIVFGATVSGRPAELSGVESMVGLFINTQPVRVNVDRAMRTSEWLDRIQAEQSLARQFEHCRLTSIQGWSEVPRTMPLFESIVVFENYPASAMRPGAESHGVRDIAVVETTNYPIALIAAPGDELELRLNFDRSRFEQGAMERMADHLAALLEEMAADPEARVSELSMMTEIERRRVVHEWNDTATAFPSDRCLHELFAEQAERTPDAAAVAFGDDTLTYAELRRRADRLASALRGRGVGPETLVGIAMDRSPEMVVAVLGVLSAGGAWVPIDVDQPADRMGFVLNDASPKVVVTTRARRGDLPEGIECVDVDDPGVSDEVGAGATPENLAYVIYTSGSTGRPKGVLIEHRGACNLAFAQAKLFGVTAGTRVLQFAAPTFDAAVSEIFVTLLNGGTLVMARREQLIGQDLADLLQDAEIHVVTVPPSVLATLPDVELPRLRTLVVAGEACPAELARRWSEGRSMINAYGPTEATVCATAGPLDDCGRVTIGRPIDNVRVYIVDADLQPVATGVAGELLIGGAGVARGYLRRPELNAERFVADPFAARDGTRVYRTGDRARFLEDGRIEYLGRVDRQVKIRGFRIEPGEVEAALLQHEPVREAVVIDREDTPGHRRLVAYLTSRDGEEIRTRDVRKALQAKLPRYMMPSAFVTLDEIPLTAHGKVDRNALPAPTAIRLELERRSVPPRTSLEQVMANIWQQVLGVERIGVHDNFFDAGGHSLLAMQVASRVREDLAVELPIAAVFGCPTVAGLCDRMLQDGANRGALEATADLLLATAGMTDEELEAFAAAGLAA